MQRREFLGFMGLLVPGWYELQKMENRLEAIAVEASDEEEEEDSSSSSPSVASSH